MLNGIWWSELEHSVFILEIIPRPTNSSVQSSQSDQTETNNAAVCLPVQAGRRQDNLPGQDIIMLMLSILFLL